MWTCGDLVAGREGVVAAPAVSSSEQAATFFDPIVLSGHPRLWFLTCAHACRVQLAPDEVPHLGFGT
jgi:hypothetical protein